MNSSIPYIEEFTVFINVKMPILKASSKLIPPIVNKKFSENNDNMNIKTVKKYFSFSGLVVKNSVNKTLFLNIWFGFECDSNSFTENLISEYTFTNLSPELVEKKDPPIITRSKKIKLMLFGILSNEIPILDILLVIEKRTYEKLCSSLKKIKNRNTRNTK